MLTPEIAGQVAELPALNSARPYFTNSSVNAQAGPSRIQV